jgi:hypothetical protein
MMVIGDVSAFAATLRQAGFDARNLGKEGLTVWRDGKGFYFSMEELRQLKGDATPRYFDLVLEERQQK